MIERPCPKCGCADIRKDRFIDNREKVPHRCFKCGHTQFADERVYAYSADGIFADGILQSGNHFVDVTKKVRKSYEISP